MMDENASGATTDTKPRQLPRDASKDLGCQTWELEVYVIGKKMPKISEHIINITELCFRRIKLLSVYGIVFIRNYPLFLTQILFEKYFVFSLLLCKINFIDKISYLYTIEKMTYITS